MAFDRAAFPKKTICPDIPWGALMPTEISYTHARANLAALCEEAISTREPIIIHRRGGEDVALVAADELRGLMETAHLLRSPKNAERLLNALARAQNE